LKVLITVVPVVFHPNPLRFPHATRQLISKVLNLWNGFLAVASPATDKSLG